MIEEKSALDSLTSVFDAGCGGELFGPAGGLVCKVRSLSARRVSRPDFLAAPKLEPMRLCSFLLDLNEKPRRRTRTRRRSNGIEKRMEE